MRFGPQRSNLGRWFDKRSWFDHGVKYCRPSDWIRRPGRGEGACQSMHPHAQELRGGINTLSHLISFISLSSFLLARRPATQGGGAAGTTFFYFFSILFSSPFLISKCSKEIYITLDLKKRVIPLVPILDRWCCFYGFFGTCLYGYDFVVLLVHCLDFGLWVWNLWLIWIVFVVCWVRACVVCDVSCGCLFGLVTGIWYGLVVVIVWFSGKKVLMRVLDFKIVRVLEIFPPDLSLWCSLSFLSIFPSDFWTNIDSD